MSDPSSQPLSERQQYMRVGLVLAAMAIVLALVYVLVLRDSYEPLLADLPRENIALARDHLNEAGIPNRLTADGTGISVPSRQGGAARIALTSAEVQLSAVDGWEIFDTNEMGLTDFAQRIRFQRALQGELTRTLINMDDIAEARVHIALAERTLFRQEQNRSTAAVSLISAPGVELGPSQIEGVQRLVAAAVPDMRATDVVVLASQGDVVSVLEAVDTANVITGSNSGTDELVQLRAVVRDVLQDQVFDLMVERQNVTVDVVEPSENAGETSTEPFAPQTQARLNVIIVSSTPLPTRYKQSIQARLDALRFENGRQVGTISFGVDATLAQVERVTNAEAADPGAAATSPTPTPSLTPATPAPLVWPIGLALGLILAIGAAVLWRLVLRPDFDSPRHEALAARLQLLLDTPSGGVHADR
ncbi:flagellar basal-body MS-ring/collar protein FliF [Maricaulis sp. D1M11]|uniref:flagellar basal-body MS-ring/collar protein FliF n=1 Tax=Maricaulis sp. D1M11 TaxID=3076117 RepID=UPI0039B4E687